MKKNKNQCINYLLMVIQILIAIILMVKLLVVGLFPIKYIVLYIVAVIFCCVLSYFSTKKKATFFLMAFIQVVISVVMIYGLIALVRFDNTIQNMSNDSRLETVQMSVYVRANDNAKTMQDISGEKIGCLKDDDGVDSVKKEIESVVEKNPIYKDYSNTIFLVDALLEEEEKAIVLNSAYLEILSEIEGYEDIKEKVKELKTISVEIKKDKTDEKENNYELSSDEDTLVVYLSGIDMWGAVNARSRSDVNIIAVINTKTHHIQLINTPRDYYVYLPKQEANDKLTHAGLYGVDSSMAALENLYDVDIDYYVRMNFSGFESIINTLGGVDVYSEYDFTVDPIKHYTVGYNHVNGLEALAFARERHAFATGDIQRGINQMEVIKAVIRKMISPAILANYDELLLEVEDCVLMDVPSEVIYDLVRHQIASGKSWTVDSYTVTGTGESLTTYSMPNVTCYVMQPNDTDVAEAKRLIGKVLSEE